MLTQCPLRWVASKSRILIQRSTKPQLPLSVLSYAPFHPIDCSSVLCSTAWNYCCKRGGSSGSLVQRRAPLHSPQSGRPTRRKAIRYRRYHTCPSIHCVLLQSERRGGNRLSPYLLWCWEGEKIPTCHNRRLHCWSTFSDLYVSSPVYSTVRHRRFGINPTMN